MNFSGLIFEEVHTVYRHDLTMLAVISLWEELLFSDRESTVESGDAHTHTGSDDKGGIMNLF